MLCFCHLRVFVLPLRQHDDQHNTAFLSQDGIFTTMLSKLPVKPLTALKENGGTPRFYPRTPYQELGLAEIAMDSGMDETMTVSGEDDECSLVDVLMDSRNFGSLS